MSKEWSLSLAIKDASLTKKLSDFIELDKLLLTGKFDLESFNQCFKLLRRLGFNSTTHLLCITMIYGSIVILIRAMFLLRSLPLFIDLKFTMPNIAGDPHIKITNSDLSLSKKQSMLRGCQDSSLMGSDNVPSFVIHQSAEVISPPVHVLFQSILYNKHWFSVWKHAIITPLHKSGPKSLVSDYRPVSIVPVLSLVFERILYDFVYPKVRLSIKREHHGFMKSRSTVTQLISYLDVTCKARNLNIPCLSIYFDSVQKAFDSVLHHLLLNKLQKFGFFTLISIFF